MLRCTVAATIGALIASPAFAQNLLPNPDFDVDVSGWMPEAVADADWDADDFESSGQSGSLRFTFPGDSGSRVARTCALLGPQRDYILSGWMRVPPEVEQGSIAVFGFTSADCGTGFQGFLGGTSLFPNTDIWSFREAAFMVPADIVSVHVNLSASDPEAGTYAVRFDSLFLPEPAPAIRLLAAFSALAIAWRRRREPRET